MQALLSPGSLVTLAGALLSVIGWVGYASGNPNLSLPTIFYGIPILLGGLALKSSELPPPERLTPPDRFLADVLRWRYGQKAHLESSLEVLKLWDEDNPPQLVSVEELEQHGGYGLRLRFRRGAVPWERWLERRDRLGRFFGDGLVAELEPLDGDGLQLTLSPLAAAAPAG